jgi:hypothetical protein
MLFLGLWFLVTVIGKLIKANDDQIIGATVVIWICAFIWYVV